MSVELLGKVGEQELAKGAEAPITLNRHGYVVVQDSMAAAAERGRLFIVCLQAPDAMAAGLSATTPVLTLYNPAGSGVTGRLWMASWVNEVANTAALTVWLAAGSNAVGATTTGTITTYHRNMKLGGITPASQGNKIVALANATLPAAPVGIDMIGCGLTGAITVVPSVPAITKWYYGAVLIQPGTNISLQSSTASAAASSTVSFIWEECDLIA